MFDGSFRTKKAINLSGNRQNVDKQKLLRKAQEERRIREAESSRQKAAERIQAWYRGRSVANKVRQDVRSGWDQDTQALRQYVLAETQSSLLPASIDKIALGAESAIKKLLFFFRPLYDHQRLVQLCSLLILVSVHNARGRLFTIPYYRSPDHQAEWNMVLDGLIPVIIKHLGEHSSWDEGDSVQVFTFLDALTLAESFQSVLGTAPEVYHLAIGFAQKLFKAEVFSHCARFLVRIPLDEKSRPSIAKALLLSIRICKSMEYYQEYPQGLDQFITHIMTIPLLPNRISIETLTTFTSRLPFDTILQHLSTTSCSVVASLPQFKITPLVANILAFGYQRVGKMSPPVSSAYLRVLTILLGMIPQELAPRADADDDEDMDDIEWRSEELLGSSQKSPDLSTSTSKLDPRIMKWLSLAYNSNHLNDILGTVEPSAVTTTFGSEQEVLSAEAIGEITNLLLNLITLFPSHKTNILSNLIYFKFGGKSKQTSNSGGGKFFGISIIKIFLDAFMSTALYKQLLQSMLQDTPRSIQALLDSAHEKAWSLLAFVCELYCQILMTMGDDEFHDDTRNPINLQSVVMLSSVVR
ncbi:hypothetical protein BGZ65_009436, partial [Modicella reniformis]